jgi:hypothetical protein
LSIVVRKVEIRTAENSDSLKGTNVTPAAVDLGELTNSRIVSTFVFAFV